MQSKSISKELLTRIIESLAITITIFCNEIFHLLEKHLEMQ